MLPRLSVAAIKYGLTKEHNLHKIGPGDLMSQLIQFMQTFVIDANEGAEREGATADAQSRGKNKDLGGWAAQEESVSSSRRRGPPPTGEPAEQKKTAQGDPDEVAAEEMRETLRELDNVSCMLGCYRPYQICGIDWKKYIDGSEVTGFGASLLSCPQWSLLTPPLSSQVPLLLTLCCVCRCDLLCTDTHQAGYMDFASALHGLNHALNSDAFAASAAGGKLLCSTQRTSAIARLLVYYYSSRFLSASRFAKRARGVRACAQLSEGVLGSKTIRLRRAAAWTRTTMSERPMQVKFNSHLPSIPLLERSPADQPLADLPSSARLLRRSGVGMPKNLANGCASKSHRAAVVVLFPPPHHRLSS